MAWEHQEHDRKDTLVVLEPFLMHSSSPDGVYTQGITMTCYMIFLKFKYNSMEEVSNNPAKLKLTIFFLLYEYVATRYM